MGFPNPTRILVVRLGALGDIIHALPAVATLQMSFPEAHLTWAVEPRWVLLLRDNPHVDRVLPIDLAARRYLAAYRDLRAGGFDLAVDLQGLMKSALVASSSTARRIAGFDWALLREKPAGLFYTERVASSSPHVVDRNLDLAAAVGARRRHMEFPLPAGAAEGELPAGDFVLSSPCAGWRAKQWPADYYARLATLIAERLGCPLVIDCPPGGQAEGEAIVAQAPEGSCMLHVSSVEGLIFATRRARAVVGVDSGPLHLAAALAKPGVALFGPTDPARNGPYGSSFAILRAPDAVTTYKRATAIAPSMRALEPDAVFQALERQMAQVSVLESSP